jgi:hypothetical protein
LGNLEWLGSRTDVQTIPAGTAAVSITFSLKNLQPHTVYYFRLDVYRPGGGSSAVGDIKTFTTSDAPAAAPLVVTTLDATGTTSTASTLNGTITGGGGSVYAAWFEYGTTSSLGTRTNAQTFPNSTAPVNLTQTLGPLLPGTTYYFRAVAYRGSANPNVLGAILSFTTAAADTPGTLSITSSEASSITSTSVILKASANSGGASIVGFFEWGTTTSLGSHTDPQTLAGGTGVTFSQTLNNLQPKTTYYFRAAIGTSSISLIRADTKNFTTGSSGPASLSVTTNDASAVSSSSAGLQGLINPAGGPATAWFEWGTTTPLSNQTTPQSFTGSGPAGFSFTLSNLQPNTHYYYRAVGQNASGTVDGDYKAFTTPRVSSTQPQTITGVETGTIKSGYLIVTPDGTSDAPTVTFTYGTVSQGSVQSQAGVIPSMMATDASMFVEIIPSISRNIGVAIANPGSTLNAITMTLRDESGIVVGSPANVSVPAYQQVAKFVSDVFGADVIANGFRGSLRMQSSAPFAVTGLRFAGSIFSTLPVAINASVPGVPARTITAGTAPNSPAAGTVGGTTAVIIPQFALAGGWATEVALVNNSGATLVGRIDVFDTTGAPMPVDLNGETRSTFTYSIPVGGTFMLAPRDSNGQSPL